MVLLNTILKRYSIIFIIFIVGITMSFGVMTDEVSAASKKPSKVKITSVQSYDHNAVKISWGKAKHGKKYQVYRATSKNGKYKLVKTTTSRSYINKGLTTGKKYYYKVRALNSSKKGAFSHKKYASPTLRKMTGVKSTSTETAVTLTYNNVNGAKGYQIYRATSKTGTYKKLKSTTAKKITDSGLSANKTYYYKIRAYKKVHGKYKYGSFCSVQSVITKNHNYKTTVVEPSCSGKGYDLHVCTGCGSKYKDNYTAAKEHEYIVPMYVLNSTSACYWCNKRAHSGGVSDVDLVCGNSGSSQFATIAAYRCKTCDSMIDIKDYSHTCNWQPVYGDALVQRCNYCGEEEIISFVDNDTRFGDFSSSAGGRKVHIDNDCVNKCKEEHPDWNDSVGNLSNYLYDRSYSKKYVSYLQCSVCTRMKSIDNPIISLVVEGKNMDIPLVPRESEWNDFNGTEWMFPTLDDIDFTADSYLSLEPYLPLFGIYLFNTYPDKISNYIEVETCPCPLCGEILTVVDGNDYKSWSTHRCK